MVYRQQAYAGRTENHILYVTILQERFPTDTRRSYRSRKIIFLQIKQDSVNKQIEHTMKEFKIGIIGCGTIAAKMAFTLNRMDGVRCYAVASRSPEKAKAFAAKWNFDKAYGSYAELAQDAEVDLIYIATPHSEHYACARLCITNGKSVLCEKPFMVNAGQAEEIFRLAEENNVFVTEAIWTRYMPSAKKLRQLIDDKVIGNARTLSANLCYPISGV